MPVALAIQLRACCLEKYSFVVVHLHSVPLSDYYGLGFSNRWWKKKGCLINSCFNADAIGDKRPVGAVSEALSELTVVAYQFVELHKKQLICLQ